MSVALWMAVALVACGGDSGNSAVEHGVADAAAASGDLNRDANSLPHDGDAGSDGAVTPAGETGSDAAVTTAVQTCVFADTLCDRLNECAPLVIKVSYGDVETCKARLRLACVDAFNAPSTGLNNATAASCAVKTASAKCDDIVNHQADCVITGKIATDLPCGTDDQCASGWCKRDQSLCGVCAVAAGAGGFCRDSAACQLGFVCTGGGFCVVPSGAGAACDADHPCRAELYCSPKQICVARLGLGQPCTDDEQCDNLKGLFCSDTTHTCSGFDEVHTGGRCGFVGDTLALCAPGGIDSCSGFGVNGAAVGVCVAPAHDGAACGTLAGGQTCLYSAQCIAGTCRLPSSGSCK